MYASADPRANWSLFHLVSWGMDIGKQKLLWREFYGVLKLIYPCCLYLQRPIHRIGFCREGSALQISIPWQLNFRLYLFTAFAHGRSHLQTDRSPVAKQCQFLVLAWIIAPNITLNYSHILWSEVYSDNTFQWLFPLLGEVVGCYTHRLHR